MASPQSIIVVCPANLSGSAQCPSDCRKCFYGGSIAVQWNFNGQGYVEYYPNREAIEQEYEELSQDYIHKSEADQAKLTVLQDWLAKVQGVKALLTLGATVAVAKAPLEPAQKVCAYCGRTLSSVVCDYCGADNS